MPFVPLAAFLTGALLSLLLPVGALIALSMWYWVFSARVPATEEEAKPGTPAEAAATQAGATQAGATQVTPSGPPPAAHQG